MAKTSRESVQQMLRLTDELRDRLRRKAEENGRSLNAEIVHRLEESFEQAGSAERISKLELEKHYLGKMYHVERDARRIIEEGSFYSRTILYMISDLLRQAADGKVEQLNAFIEQAKAEPALLDFKRPSADDLDDEDDA